MKNIAEVNSTEFKNEFFPDVLNTKFSGLEEITPENKATFTAELKVITPGLALEPGQMVTFHKFVGATIDTSAGMAERNPLFKMGKGSRKGIYAIISIGDRGTKIPLESLVNPVTLTGVTGSDPVKNATYASLIDGLNKNPKCFIPKGAPSIDEVLSWKGQTREVIGVVKGFTREVNATAPGKSNEKVKLDNLSAVWFALEPNK